MLNTVGSTRKNITHLDGCDVECGAVGEEHAVLHQPLIPGVQHRVQHRLVEEAVAHPLGDDDVHLLHGQRDLLHLTLDDFHDWETRGGGVGVIIRPEEETPTKWALILIPARLDC